MIMELLSASVLPSRAIAVTDWNTDGFITSNTLAFKAGPLVTTTDSDFGEAAAKTFLRVSRRSSPVVLTAMPFQLLLVSKR